MESIRKIAYRDAKSGRDIVYVVGSSICNNSATITAIETEIKNNGKEFTYVYIRNKNKESCLWKKIIITWNNVIEMEYDWTKIIGYD